MVLKTSWALLVYLEPSSTILLLLFINNFIIFNSLVGFAPFWHRRQMTMIKNITEGKYVFGSPEWDDITDGPKDLVRNYFILYSRFSFCVSFCIFPPLCSDNLCLWNYIMKSLKDVLPPAYQFLHNFLLLPPLAYQFFFVKSFKIRKISIFLSRYENYLKSILNLEFQLNKLYYTPG